MGMAERNYAQLDCKGLAVVFATQHFQKFMAGSKVTFYTELQPLLGILDSTKPVPQVLSLCMAHWCI